MILSWKSLLPFCAGICILLYTGCKPKNNETLTYFPETKQVARRYTSVNGKIEGTMTEYYRDGKVRMERQFKNDIQTGRTVLYHPDGKLMEAQYFDEAGVQQGGDTLWYPDGRVQFVTNFKDGKKDGYLRKWSPDGVIFLEARYEMDSLKEVKKQLPPKKSDENQ